MLPVPGCPFLDPQYFDLNQDNTPTSLLPEDTEEGPSVSAELHCTVKSEVHSTIRDTSYPSHKLFGPLPSGQPLQDSPFL